MLCFRNISHGRRNIHCRLMSANYGIRTGLSLFPSTLMWTLFLPSFLILKGEMRRRRLSHRRRVLKFISALAMRNTMQFSHISQNWTSTNSKGNRYVISGVAVHNLNNTETGYQWSPLLATTSNNIERKEEKIIPRCGWPVFQVASFQCIVGMWICGLTSDSMVENVQWFSAQEPDCNESQRWWITAVKSKNIHNPDTRRSQASIDVSVAAETPENEIFVYVFVLNNKLSLLIIE